jgi:hypothetical protein
MSVLVERDEGGLGMNFLATGLISCSKIEKLI